VPDREQIALVLVVDHREEFYIQCHDEQSPGRYLANLLLTATEADRGCLGFAMEGQSPGPDQQR
jgi:hypothetical protein